MDGVRLAGIASINRLPRIRTSAGPFCADELPNDPQYQPPLPLEQVRDLADCLVPQCFHEFRIEHRLAPVQRVGGLHPEHAGQRRNLAHRGIADSAGPNTLDVFLREVPSVMHAIWTFV